MHKLKNKHTGEVITTPYMAEVEEYLNSGDYEMSDKKYPFIGRANSGNDYLVYSKREGFKISKETFHENLNTNMFENVTREYLANTYGKCESQEHADFICKLAENAGFNATNDYSALKGRVWFVITSYRIEFLSLPNDTKLIHLPLPPKEKEMTETKPVYTKEMHERGELPPVGSFVEVINYGKGEVKLEQDIHGYSCVLVNGEYHLIKQCEIKPIPTIEDEFKEFIRDSVTNMNIDELHKSILTKYNITPKDS